MSWRLDCLISLNTTHQVYTYNIIEARLSNPNWLDLPKYRYITELSTLAERWTSGQPMTAEQTSAITAQFELSQEHIKEMVNDDTSHPKLCFTMGIFAKHAIMSHLWERAEEDGADRFLHRLDLPIPVPALTALKVPQTHYNIEVTLVIDNRKLTQIYLHDTHSETPTFNGLRDASRYRAAFAMVSPGRDSTCTDQMFTDITPLGFLPEPLVQYGWHQCPDPCIVPVHQRELSTRL